MIYQVLDSSSISTLKRIAVIFLVLFLKNDFTMGQRTDTSSNTKGLVIKMAPTRLPLGELKFLGEKYLNENNSIELIQSYFLNNSLFLYYSSFAAKLYGNLLEEFSNRMGFKIGLSYRYYFERSMHRPFIFKPKRVYRNLIISYTYLDYTEASKVSMLGFYLYEGDGDYRYRYNFFKTSYSIQYNYGTNYSLGNFFFIDAYIGVGVRYLIINITDYTPKSPYAPMGRKDDFNSLIPTLHLGLNICYKIKNTQ